MVVLQNDHYNAPLYLWFFMCWTIYFQFSAVKGSNEMVTIDMVVIVAFVKPKHEADKLVSSYLQLSLLWKVEQHGSGASDPNCFVWDG
jgi:hypothetical protein